MIKQKSSSLIKWRAWLEENVAGTTETSADLDHISAKWQSQMAQVSPEEKRKLHLYTLVETNGTQTARPLFNKQDPAWWPGGKRSRVTAAGVATGHLQKKRQFKACT